MPATSASAASAPATSSPSTASSRPRWRPGFEGGLWLGAAASRANTRAAALARGLAAIPGVTLAHPVEANAVFARWPRGLHRAAMAAGAEYYLWDFDATLDGPDDELLLARLVCGWSTTEEEVRQFVALVSGAAATAPRRQVAAKPAAGPVAAPMGHYLWPGRLQGGASAGACDVGLAPTGGEVPMTVGRSAVSAVFHQPFRLPGQCETLPPGEYALEVETAPAAGRGASVLIHLAPHPASSGPAHTVTVPLADLGAALAAQVPAVPLDDLLADPMVQLFMASGVVAADEIRSLVDG